MKHYFEYLENSLKHSWQRQILSDFEGESFTGSDITGWIAGIHCYFDKIGLSKGDRVAIYGSSCARWAITFLAINTYEAVAVPILPDFRGEDAANLVSHSEASVIFADRACLEKMKGLSINAVCLDDWGGIEKVEEGEISFPRGNENNLAIINYTSGTTSAPKGVMLTYNNLSTNVQYALDHIPPHPGDRIVSMLPMAHMYGFMFEMLYPLCGGVAVWYLGKAPTPTKLMEALRQIRPYLLITVPLVMEKIFGKAVLPSIAKLGWLMRVPIVSKFILIQVKRRMMTAFGGNVREIIMGGAPLNTETERWFKRIGLPYTVGYGMTEAAPLLAFENWPRFAAGSCGKVADRCQIRISSGEIQAKGVNIMAGYWKNREATDAAFTEDGWLRTGDSGVIDREGNIFIRGRIKNMLLSSNGQNIYPEEIESVAAAEDGVQESLAVQRNGRIVLLVYTAGENLAENFIERINSKLPTYCKVNGIEIMSEPFEKTPKMSIKRHLYS